MTATNPKALSLGLFDSGIGGLTVAKEIFNYMPCEGIVYFGDTARVPYGSKSTSQLRRFATEIIDFLLTRGVKYVIFACNTSSSVSLNYVKHLYKIPMIGVVRPGANEAVSVSSNGKIGVIATEATIKSGAYELAVREAAQRHNKGFVQVYSMAAPKLVPLVESGQWSGKETESILREYLIPLKEKGIDTLVLGCTHYPFLLKPIQSILEPGTAIVDPAKLTVKQAYSEMLHLGILNNTGERPEHEYWVSGNAEKFKTEAQKFLGMSLLSVNSINLRKA